VLSCGSDSIQADAAKCRLINDHMHPGRARLPKALIGLAHVPALDPHEASAELRPLCRRAGVSGVVIASSSRAYTRRGCFAPILEGRADLGLYVFITLCHGHQLAHMDADDLGRMLGGNSR